ncbi:arylamine N-acetyltransferase family protein [Phenylobacterium soli]|uniref:Arylamine N-acetyltransferase n=1 Tax=Phenylobacterium soli TaxID=2170551 RepID=A0A328AM84_9CAUL|nr:arylamine N-acetyltransferase [Phenylobacterium soli]RAK56062.1 arylamine N-acetyltransferase [Phenylobacterium soli]
MSPLVDLDAYCERIGYAGPREPTIEVLRALCRLHPAAIPFEAIDVLTGQGVDLRPEAVDAKLIGARRGGYCFEQNSLLARVLRSMGFEVEALIARSRWGRPLDDVRPRTHMALRVLIDGTPWLADVGLGVCTLTAPVRLDLAGPQPTLFDPVRLVPAGEELRLETLLSGEWRPVVDLDLRPQLEADFVGPNWYVSTHPESQFRRHLIVSRATRTARYGLLDNRLAIRPRGAPAEVRLLGVDELIRCLSRDFGLPVSPAWEPALARAATVAV